MADPLPWPQLDSIPPGWLGDTPPEAVAVCRRMTPARRVATAHRLLTTARALLTAGVRLREPDLAAPGVAARVRALLADLVARLGVRAQWDQVVGAN